MNTTRLALAAVAATLADGIYGFLVYGTALAGSFAAYPMVYRSAEDGAAHLPGMFVGILVAMFVVAYIYAKGYEGGSGVREGVRFGLLLAIFNACYVVGVAYANLNIGGRLAALLALAGVGEWVVVGGTIGLVYRRAAAVRGSAAKSAKV
jgi:hypothetical protein